MPINFSQPEPMAPGITAGAAAAEFAAKTFPTIAQIYENAARLRASGGGGGGGHGAPVQSGGPIQVLPSGDGGEGLYQVEGQANREQRALDLGFEAQQDPVSRHIVLQGKIHQDAEDRKSQQQQQQFQQMNPDLFPQAGGRGQPAAQSTEPGPTTWGPDDESSLAGTMQAIDGVRNKVNSGAINNDTYYKLMQPLDQQRSQLLAKQRKANEDDIKQKNQQEVQRALHQTAMTVAQGRGLLSHAPSAPSDIPGMIPDRMVPDGRGGWKNVNEPKQLQMQKSADAMKLEQMRIEAKDRTEKDSGAMYLKDRALAISELGNKVTGKMPDEKQIRDKIAQIREHRDILSGKKPQQSSPGAVTPDVIDARKKLLDKIGHTMPGMIPTEDPSSSQE